MVAFSELRRSYAAGRAHYGGEQLPAPQPGGGGPPDAGKMTPIKIGHYYDKERGCAGPPLFYRGERHAVIFGLNGAGKSTRSRSVFVLDLKGEPGWNLPASDMRLLCASGNH